MHLGRIEFNIVFVYGLVFCFRLLSTPPLNDAVTFSYGQASVPVRQGLSPFCWRVLSGAPFPGTSCQATIAPSLRDISQQALARRYHIPIPPQRDLPISWNIVPSQDVLAIRYNPKTQQRSLDAVRWGLFP